MTLPPDPRWGIIGFGEVGSAFARHISGHTGCRVAVTDLLLNQAPHPEHMRKRLAEVEVDVASDVAGLVARCDVVLSVVTPGSAASVAGQAGKSLRNALYIDFNSVSPVEKQEMSALFQAESYVDGSIMGSVTAEGAGAALAVAGPRSEQAHDWLRAASFRSSLIGPQVGAASAMKMCRSVFMKGIECLLLETLLAAEQFSLTDRVLQSIEQTLSSYKMEALVKMLVTTHAPHCGRRAEEMQRAVEMLTALRLPSLMSEAARDFLQASCQAGLPARFNFQTPDGQEEVIRYLARFYQGAVNGQVAG